jgi:iron complex outermembrane receptor protein
MAFALTQAVLCASAHAQVTQKRVYHLASAPLDQTLIRIARESQTRLSYDPNLVKGAKSGAVDGSFTASEAISHALTGTGFMLVETANGVLTIASKPANAEKKPVPAVVPKTDASNASSGADAALPLISVAASRDSGGTGFVAESSSTFTRTDTPLSETPKSVSVINAAVIQSQSDQNLTDILRNAAGVVARPGPFGVPSYTVRGFTAGGGNVLTDGLATGSASSAANLTPSIAIASVEVLKGPSAIMAGDSPPGGVINITKKKPQAEPFHEIQLGVGKYGEQQIALDSTGGLAFNDKLRYRFVMSGDRQGQNDMGYDGQRQFYFAPTIEWKDATTDVSLAYTRTTARIPLPPYTIGLTDGGLVPGRIGHPLGNPSDHFSIRSDDVTLNAEQKVGDHFTLVSRTGYSRSDFSQMGWASASTLDPDGSTVLYNSEATGNYYTWATQNYVRAKFDFGKLKTTTLVGVDYTTFHQTQSNPTTGTVFNSIPNVLAGVDLPALYMTQPASGYGIVYRKTGIFLQEQANYERFHILASIRRDHYLEGGTTDGRPASRGTNQSAYSPSIGAMYQLTDSVAVYANYMKGYMPATATTYLGTMLPPQRSSQVEAGFKFNLLDDRLSVTTDAYRITYTNQNISDPQHPGYYMSAGGSVSRGFELEFTGQLLPGLNLIGSYSYNDYVQAYNPTAIVNLPKHTASLWMTYNFRTPMLQGFGVGGGLFFTGNQKIGYSQGYKIPSQVETDVGVFYRHKNYGLNLSIKNLFDRNLYYSSTTPSYVPMGTSRTFMLTGTYDF